MTILVSALIGYITNLIAIKMLFRPKNAKYLHKYKLPFTPGLIPKERDRLASRVGESVTHLLSAEALRKHLTKNEVLTRIYQMYDETIEENALTRMLTFNTRFWLFEQLVLLSLTHMSALLNQIKIGSVIIDSMNDFSADQLEDMVLNVARKELKSIAWFGAILGGLIGLFHTLIIGVF